MTRHIYVDELRHLSELVASGDVITKSLQRKMAAKYGFEFDRARIDFQIRRMGIIRKRKYPQEVRDRFVALARDNTGQTTKALLDLFERATGESVDYGVARYWRNSGVKE